MKRKDNKNRIARARAHQAQVRAEHRRGAPTSKDHASVPVRPRKQRRLSRWKKQKELAPIPLAFRGRRPQAKAKSVMRDTSIRALEGTRYQKPKERCGSKRRRDRGRRGAHPQFKSKHGFLTNIQTSTY